MRIQLIHPPTLVVPTNLANNRPTPPLGLAYVTAALRAAGHECSVLDAIGAAPTHVMPQGASLRLGLSDEQIVARIDPAAQAIAVTCMFSFSWPMLRELIKTIHARFPDKPIVCGGEHFSALPELCMSTAPIDFVVMGEGEEIATELFARLGAGVPFDPGAIRGICWRRDGTIVRNPRAERTKTVDLIPWPAWDLFDLQAYNDNDLVNGLRMGTTVPILATRGCPYQCTYCASPSMWTTRWYTREPSDVVDEIETYHRRYGATNFPFQDLTMIVKKDWIVSFCHELLRRDLDVSWQLPTGTRCEVIDEEVAGLLARAGCRWLSYAPESGSERTRELIKKKMKTESLMRAVDASVGAGLHLSTFIVIGFPHDTPDDLRETARTLRRLARKGVEDVSVHFFYPIPATELFRHVEATGRVRPDDTVLMAPLFGLRGYLEERFNFCEHMTAPQLTRWKYWLIANFYLTAWALHPTRPFRVALNAARGRQTSSMEKFLGDTARRVVRRLTRRERRAQRAQPVVPY
jgi:radical SAM superfamily enzyme YgiQ (UPF0313 family)